jgi:hypothetical protein
VDIERGQAARQVARFDEIGDKGEGQKDRGRRQDGIIDRRNEGGALFQPAAEAHSKGRRRLAENHLRAKIAAIDAAENHRRHHYHEHQKHQSKKTMPNSSIHSS